MTSPPRWSSPLTWPLFLNRDGGLSRPRKGTGSGTGAPCPVGWPIGSEILSLASSASFATMLASRPGPGFRSTTV